jgi:hypothetical protein
VLLGPKTDQKMAPALFDRGVRKFLAIFSFNLLDLDKRVAN